MNKERVRVEGAGFMMQMLSLKGILLFMLH